MKKTFTFAGIVTSAAVLAGLCVVSPAAGSFEQGAHASAVLKPPRKDPPSRGGGGNSGAQQQQRASQERAAQQRAAQERASQQRAAQERASQQRAAQQRAAQERAAQDRAAQQRAQEGASQQRASQERVAQDRAAQQRALEEAARRRGDESARQRQAEDQRASADSRRQPERESVAERIAQQRQDAERRAAQEDPRSRLGGDNSSDRSLFERERDSANNQQERARDQIGQQSLQPERSAERSAALDDMRKRLEAIRRNDASSRDPGGSGNRGPGAADLNRPERNATNDNLLQGPEISRDRDGERENSAERDGRTDLKNDETSRFRATPLAPGALQNSGRGEANDQTRRGGSDLDRSRQSGPGPSIDLPRSSSRGAIDGRDPKIFSYLDRDQRNTELIRHSNHLSGRDGRSGPPSKLPLRGDFDRDDIDIHRHVNNSVHFHDHFHSKKLVVNHWVHHPRFVHHHVSHFDHDFAFLHFSTGSFGFGFGFGGHHHHHHHFPHHFSFHYAPVRYVYLYDDYCDWYYGSWYRPYVKVVHHYDYTPAYRSYGSTYYSSGGVLTSGDYGYDDDSGTSIFGDDVVGEAPATIDEAWQLLVDGFLTEAREMFVEIGTRYPFEGEPQIGYAIAAGLLHDDEAAAFALRKAMTDQPEAIVLVPQNLAMQGHLERLLDRWEEKSRVEPSADAMFMIAALRFMLQDEATAYFAVDEAINAGDDDASARNLKDIIRASMYETIYDE